MATHAAGVTTRASRATLGLRQWGPSALGGAVTVALGWLTADGFGTISTGPSTPATIVSLIVAGLAVAIARSLTGSALMLSWVSLALHYQLGTPVTAADLGVLWIAFAVARWGMLAVVWLSALSIPAAAFALDTLAVFRDQVSNLVGWRGLLRTHPSLSDQTGFLGSSELLYGMMFIVVLAMLLLPWLLGLLLRTVASVREARRLEAQAEAGARLSAEHAAVQRELASLRASQTQLARDVHDAVGHSLAVVLAQAQSAQFLTDPEAIQRSLSQIADSARSSLQDVRTVLESTRDGGRPTSPPPREIDDLVEGVRQAGYDVAVEVAGTPRPLPRETETVLYRICQETLTNALRHGLADAPIRVTQDWVGAALIVSVENLCPAGAPVRAGGSGIDGMRRRLDSIGGTLEAYIVRGDTPEGPLRFVTRAWLPVGTAA